ncbi:MAG: MarR family transcriptional regulator [Candidatus Cohnella colombiensis]|uniref:MarR family transcriptional regulator n=1 Tax=Candidatus Cohnella colombiensis TaxID=3121368 RepID=A0AA95JA67_9BACL|nr:MAG: MarR family transcriptional regulator [Cohnella sp.]
MENAKNASLSVYIALNRASEWLNAHADRDIRNHGLNRTEFGVLELLYHKGSQPLQQIGGKVLMSSGNITYVVDKLEKKCLVQRQTSSADRRLIYAEITEQGKQFIEQVFPKHARLIEEIVQVLSIDEQETLSDLLKKLGKFAQEEWKK